MHETTRIHQETHQNPETPARNGAPTVMWIDGPIGSTTHRARRAFSRRRNNHVTTKYEIGHMRRPALAGFAGIR